MSAVPPRDDLPSVGAMDMQSSAHVDASRGAEVASAWAANCVLVRPLLNGKDVGWFILDSGASGWTIDSRAAASAGLEQIGRVTIGGPRVGQAAAVYTCATVTLGPLVLDGLELTGLDMHNTAWSFGREVVGIAGREAFASVAIELDGRSKQIRMMSEASEIAEAAWHDIELRNNLPCVRCRYAKDAEGLFMLDTGCNVAVHVFGRAVTEHDLLADPSRIRGSRTQTNFGSSEKVSLGSLDHFAVGAEELGPLHEVTFAQPGDALPLWSSIMHEADGLIGLALAERFVIVLDLPHSRVAFVPLTQREQ